MPMMPPPPPDDAPPAAERLDSLKAARLRIENARRAEQAGQFGSKTLGYAAVALGCRRRWA
jgi:hypothetical protein